MTTKPIFDDIAPWPERKTAPSPAPIGHNKPPLEELIPVEFRAALLGERPDFLTLMDNYLGAGDPNSEDYKPGAVHRAKCTDEETLGNCGKVINTLRAILSHAEATHKAVKEPYLSGGRLVDAELNAIKGRVLAGRAIVQGLMDDYANEQLRLRRIEEARLAKEVADAAAERKRLEDKARETGVFHEYVAPPVAAPLPVPAPIRTDGATVSLGTEWYAIIDDYAKAFRHVKDDSKVREAIDAAIGKIVKASKANTNIPGVRAMERAKTSSR
jgi:hypothetical protein